MRREYAKVLREAIDREMSARFPDFRLEKPPSSHYWPEERVYVRRIGNTILHLIIVSPHPKGRESFGIEIGWSKEGRIPLLIKRPSSGIPVSSETLSKSEFVTRLGYFADPPQEFWDIEEDSFEPKGVEAFVAQAVKGASRIDKAEAESRVLPRVMDAVQLLAEKGLPYLARATGG